MNVFELNDVIRFFFIVINRDGLENWKVMGFWKKIGVWGLFLKRVIKMEFELVKINYEI